MRWAAFFLFAAAIPAFAADQWTRITTPEFELYTTGGEKKGKETIRRLEQVREFFQKASPVRAKSEAPVRIVQFDIEQQYLRYSGDALTAAFFFATPEHDYIVLGNTASVNYQVAIHEYMHLIIRHSGLKIPVWLNEGWADVYSTLRPMGKETAVGDLLADRMQALARERWLDFDELTSTSHSSANYHEASRIGVFYAESWALTHMLYLSPEYKDNFGKFVMALNRGSTTAEACKIAFDRTPDQVYHDLQVYLDRKKIYGRVFEAGMNEHEREPVVSAVPEFDARLMLTDVLISTGKVPEAKKELARLEKEQPDRPDLARAIGNVALGSHDTDTARRYFEKAFQEGDADPDMCVHLALLEGMAQQRPEQIIPILERALKSKPDYTEAKIRLGLVMVDAHNFTGALSTLMAIPNVNPEQAPAVFCGLSYAYAETGDIAAARENAEKCRKWAKTDVDVKRAEELLKLASGPAHAAEKLRRIAGTMRNVECSSEGNRLLLVTENKLIAFDLPAMNAVEMVQKPPGFELTCGALKPTRVAVDYAPPYSAIETSVGIVRRLVF